jgi:hypothetical protein
MVTEVTETDIVNLSGQIIAGIFANPASANIVYDMYQRQQIIQQVFSDVQNAFMGLGITLKIEQVIDAEQA